MTTVRFVVFEMGDGTRFITPRYAYEVGDASQRPGDVEIGSALLALGMNLKRPEGDDGWLVAEADADGRFDLPHRLIRIFNGDLMHGAIDVACISGPGFEKPSAEGRT
jgi:hypothetical protein